jgi:hypothetical protein
MADCNPTGDKESDSRGHKPRLIFKEAIMSRKQIWMNPPLERLAEQATGKGRDGTFSRRLGDIVERYDALMKLTPVPELTDEEKMIIGAVVCGSVISPLTIKYMDESVIESGAGSSEFLQQLSGKVKTWSVAERIAVIESLGI